MPACRIRSAAGYTGRSLILHLVTDRRQLASGAATPGAVRSCLLRQVGYAVAAGVEIIQIRERDLGGAQLVDLVGDIIATARGSHTRVLVNDRLDVALACGADGVHLRADSIAPAAVRPLVGTRFLIGRSVHTEQEARDVSPHVDYVIAGTVWRSASKPGPHDLLGLEGLRRIVSAAAVPVIAIGGVTSARLDAAAAAGAAGVAAIGLFMSDTRSSAGCRAGPLDVIARAARSL